MDAHCRHLADSQAQSCEDAFDEYCDDIDRTLKALDVPVRQMTRRERLAAFDDGLNPQDAAEDFASTYDPECDGHPAGPFDSMGETVYCDGSCKR